jgi:muramoyltetrapeptide carboxypeptidase
MRRTGDLPKRILNATRFVRLRVYLLSMRFPPLLAAGSHVALVSPAGPFRDDTELERAKSNVRSFGWEPVVMTNARARDGYLAGTDEQRARDLNNAIIDPEIDGLWCLRGGYGAMRILDALDYQTLARNPKTLIGYSDVTALHAAFGRLANLVTFHGPTARQVIPEMARSSLQRAVGLGEDPCGTMPKATTLIGGRATGTLVGGNLALLTALIGTPYAPDYHGAILVIEDVNEAHYRLDRMLTHLRLSGAMAGVAGIVFGRFTDIPKEFGDEEWSLERVLQDTAERAGVPCVSGAPFGHIDDQWTIPLGARADLDADARTLCVRRS